MSQGTASQSECNPCPSCTSSTSPTPCAHGAMVSRRSSRSSCERFEGRLGLRVVTGGLRAGHAAPMRAEDKAYIRDAWTRVAAASGQPFDFSFLDREGFVYDTEPACRAVVTARRLLPRLALPFMGRIAQAFYAENRDMTSAEEISAVAEEAGFDPRGVRRGLPFRGHPQRDLPRLPGRPGARHSRLSDPDRRQRGEGLRARHQRLPAVGRPARAAGALVGLRRAGNQDWLKCPRIPATSGGYSRLCLRKQPSAPVLQHIQRHLHRGPPRTGPSGARSDGPTERRRCARRAQALPRLPRPPSGASGLCSKPPSAPSRWRSRSLLLAPRPAPSTPRAAS